MAVDAELLRQPGAGLRDLVTVALMATAATLIFLGPPLAGVLVAFAALVVDDVFTWCFYKVFDTPAAAKKCGEDARPAG